MSAEARGMCWGDDLPVKTEGVGAAAVRLVALAMADVVNDMHDNEFFGSVVKLAEKTGLSRPTVQAALKHLLSAGVIEALEERPGKSSRYRWIWHPSIGGCQDALAPTCQDALAPTCQDALARTEEEQKKQQKSLSTTEMFDRFWSQYPRKKNKITAITAFERAVKRHGVETVRSGYRSALDEWRSWPKERQQFIPYAASWLNGGGYLDVSDSLDLTDPRVGKIIWLPGDQPARMNADGTHTLITHEEAESNA